MPNKPKHRATGRGQKLAPATVKAISDLADEWAALDAENGEAVIPAHARTMEQLCNQWNTSYSIGLRKALKAWKAGKLNRARISRHGRRISVYWPK